MAKVAAAIGRSPDWQRRRDEEPDRAVRLLLRIAGAATVLRPTGDMHMSIIAWIVLGLVAGFIASMLVNRRGGSLFLDLILGVVGAFVGGFLFSQFGHSGVSGLNIYSFVVATLGAVLVLVIYHVVFGSRRSL
jgi:uncharacterized membrane protein YeaQ/YmgE (transglycosylase-associated protein family)